MTRLQIFASTLLIAVLLVGCGTEMPAQQAGGTHRIEGQDVAIYNIAGLVTVEPGSGSDVVVTVTTGGADGARLGLGTGTIGGRETLRVLYPDDEIVYAPLGSSSSTIMQVRDNGTFYEGNSRGSHQVRIRGAGRGLDAHADLAIAVPDGKSLFIYQGVGKVTVRNVEGRLHIDTGGAGVSVSGTRGRLSLDTGSSEVELTNVRADEVLIDSGSGSVRGSGITATALNLDTGSGDVELTGVSAERVLLDSGSGSVSLSLLTDVDQLEIDSGSGNVTLHVPAILGGQLFADTGSGDFEIDVPMQLQSREDGEVRGVIGDGNGKITIDTGSGDVRILSN